MNRRRFILAAAATAATPALAYAQTTTPTGECTIGFVNGLLQYSPDCPALTPPGLNIEIAPPSHLALPPVDEAAADTAAQEAATEEQQRLTEKRNRKDEKKNRRGDRRDKRKDGNRERQENRKDRKRENRQERNEPSAAELMTCDEFATKEELDAFWAEYEDIATQLDPNGNGKPCEDVIWPPPAPAE
jgi:hypothetical protein